MTMATADNQGTSTRPYLLRALHDWCTDNGFTPYVAVHVGPTVQVPMEYVKNNEIVLNIGFEATSNLQMGNEFIEFKARFGGVSREIRVPIDHVVAIYARENGQGMAFPVPTAGATEPAASAAAAAPPSSPVRGLRLASSEPEAEPGNAAQADDEPPPPDPANPAGRPALKRIK
jgi:stringent starvation protein B